MSRATGLFVALAALALMVPGPAAARNGPATDEEGGAPPSAGRRGGLEVSGERSDDTPRKEPESEAPARDVGLDQLLKLPSSMSFEEQERSGAGPEDWRARFRASLGEIRAAKEEIAATRKALDEAAGAGGSGQWQMGPPGANNTEVTPVSFKLREELRASRERLDEAERRHRELVIQADLAGVPEDWRRPD